MYKYVMLFALAAVTTHTVQPVLQQSDPEKVGKKIFLNFLNNDQLVGNASYEIITWEIGALDRPKKTSPEEGRKMLFRFYRRVGATVNEQEKGGYINLKDAGYFDEN